MEVTWLTKMKNRFNQNHDHGSLWQGQFKIDLTTNIENMYKYMMFR